MRVRFMIEEERRSTYGNLENKVLVVLQTFRVSIPESAISSRWIVKAAPSVASVLPGGPTRSVMSKMMLVKPSLSR
jgi:hypothetical protein